MDTLKNPNINFPVMSALGATIVTLMLLTILSNLKNIERPPITDDRPPPITINQTKPPKPPEPVRVEETEQMQLEPQTMVTPSVNQPLPEKIPPNFITRLNGPGKIEIPIIKYTRVPFVQEIFKPTQVDREPRIIKSVKPLYPFAARGKGIEGSVVLRFVVDENGLVQEPEVLRAEPKGVFEESALAAIVKYRFKPALIDDGPVKCLVILPIGFRLNQ